MSKETKKTGGPAQVEVTTPDKKPTCGIVMPIGAMGDCSVEHWLEVRQILIDVCNSAGFISSLVSDADEVGIIQKRIIQNVYSSNVVVCDVSHKNPNVMFELGMRLAFDKPTIIVKDDKTDYTFDVGVVEHLDYPRDLRYGKILQFRKKLEEKLVNTYNESLGNEKYSTFLKSFGEFKVATIETKEVSKDQLILESIDELKRNVSRVNNMISRDNGQSAICSDSFVEKGVSDKVKMLAGFLLKEYRSQKDIDHDFLSSDEYDELCRWIQEKGISPQSKQFRALLGEIKKHVVPF